MDTRALEEDQARAADARYQIDAWDEVIRGYLVGKMDASIPEIMRHALRIPEERWSPAATQRVGRILAKAGWQSRQVRVEGERCYRYFPKDGSNVVAFPGGPSLAKLMS